MATDSSQTGSRCGERRSRLTGQCARPTADHPRLRKVEVRLAERTLLVDGQRAELSARAFDVLLALIARQDRVVTKDELLDMVWPGLVVEENNLQAQVSNLRRLLGPKAIATI